MSLKYKLVVYVPTSHADAVREAMGEVGGGTLGNYSYCSFSARGVGRFKPELGAKPAIGTVGKLEQVEEERIEVTCTAKVLPAVIAAMKKVHPYEEVVYDVYSLVKESEHDIEAIFMNDYGVQEKSSRIRRMLK